MQVDVTLGGGGEVYFLPGNMIVAEKHILFGPF